MFTTSNRPGDRDRPVVAGRRPAFTVVSWLFAAAVAGPGLIAPSAAAAAPQFVCGANEYENVDHACVPRPEAGSSAPDGATAQCRDGTYSFSQHRRGTCSGHDGVDHWL